MIVAPSIMFPISDHWAAEYEPKYADKNIHFLGGVYNKKNLDNLRYFSKLYFHGHSVGGTNPSLLEALVSIFLKSFSYLLCYCELNHVKLSCHYSKNVIRTFLFLEAGFH